MYKATLYFHKKIFDYEKIKFFKGNKLKIFTVYKTMEDIVSREMFSKFWAGIFENLNSEKRDAYLCAHVLVKFRKMGRVSWRSFKNHFQEIGTRIFALI